VPGDWGWVLPHASLECLSYYCTSGRCTSQQGPRTHSGLLGMGHPPVCGRGAPDGAWSSSRNPPASSRVPRPHSPCARRPRSACGAPASIVGVSAKTACAIRNSV
jgi:hypothetical protein